MKPIIIGLVGSFGSGCSEVAQILGSLDGYHVYRLSKILEREAEREYVTLPDPAPGRRRALQIQGNQLRASRGGGILVQMTLQQWSKQVKGGSCVLDSIKNPQEILELRKRENAHVVAVGASADTRWKRLQSEYQGDCNLFETFDDIDKNEGMKDGQMVENCVHLADIVIDNEDDWSDVGVRKNFEEKVRWFARLMEQPGRREPLPPEVLMNEAHEESLNSQCLSRKVGAVVVHQEEPSGATEVLGVGYNHAPLGSKECKDEHKKCYKEKARQDLLQSLSFCPSCGSELSGGWCIDQSCSYWPGRGDILERSCPGRALDVCRAVHAEQDAIVKAIRSNYPFPANCSLYCTTFPCALCARLIIAADIKEVVYVEAYPMAESNRMLKAAGVRLLQFEGVKGEGFSKLFAGSSV